MREKILKQSVRAASRTVVTQMRRNLNRAGESGRPNATVGRSKKTGTYKKGNNAVAARRNGRKWDMYQSAGVKLVGLNHGRVILGMSGFRNRMGSQAWILEHGGNIKLWGGKTYQG